jgi:Polysaccharide lyase
MRMRLEFAGTALLGAFALIAAGGVVVTGGGRVSRLQARGSHGQIVWTADAESPLDDQWAEYSTQSNCAVVSDTVTSDRRAFRESPVRISGSHAYEFVVRDGDDCYGERSEIGQALPSRAHFTGARLFNEGDDRWISFAVRPGGDFPIETQHWDVIAQWKQLAVPGQTLCCPIIAMEIAAGRYWLDGKGARVWRGPRAVRRRWARFTLHIHFSADPATGFVDVYSDAAAGGMRRRLVRHRLPTLNRTGAGAPVPSAARIGIYRDSAIGGSAHLYFDGYTVATTRAAAEHNAFRRP